VSKPAAVVALTLGAGAGLGAWYYFAPLVFANALIDDNSGANSPKGKRPRFALSAQRRHGGDGAAAHSSGERSGKQWSGRTVMRRGRVDEDCQAEQH
jgi:hypothetical protein